MPRSRVAFRHALLVASAMVTVTSPASSKIVVINPYGLHPTPANKPPAGRVMDPTTATSPSHRGRNTPLSPSDIEAIVDAKLAEEKKKNAPPAPAHAPAPPPPAAEEENKNFGSVGGLGTIGGIGQSGDLKEP